MHSLVKCISPAGTVVALAVLGLGLCHFEFLLHSKISVLRLLEMTPTTLRSHGHCILTTTMLTSLRRFFPRVSQQRRTQSRRRSLTRTRVNAPEQSISLPLEVIQKIIDDHLSDPRDSSALWNLALTCHSMAAYCRPVLYRILKLTINVSTGPLQINSFPPAAWEHVQELALHLCHFGQNQEDRLAGEWTDFIQKLRQAPRLKAVRCMIIFSEPLGSFASRALGALLRALQHLESLTLQAPSLAHFGSLVAGLGADPTSRLSTLKSLNAICHTNNRYSHFSLGGEGFEISSMSEVAVPGIGSLQHLQLGLWRSYEEGFGHMERGFIYSYSQTLRCLHLGDRLHCSDNLNITNLPTLLSLDLRTMQALEWLEVATLISAPRTALGWVSETIATLPPTALGTERPKLKISILFNCNSVATRLRNEVLLHSPESWLSIWKGGLEDGKYGELIAHPGIHLAGFLRLQEEGRTAASAPRSLGRYGAGGNGNDSEGTSYRDFWTGCGCSGWTFKA
jgi:hypothetical protein